MCSRDIEDRWKCFGFSGTRLAVHCKWCITSTAQRELLRFFCPPGQFSLTVSGRVVAGGTGGSTCLGPRNPDLIRSPGLLFPLLC